MCSYCLRDICPPGCPNYSPNASRCFCEICGESINDGDEYIENENGAYVHLYCCFSFRKLLNWLGHEIKTMKIK